MELMGQGLVLMVAGMSIVYAFLYVLIGVSNAVSKFRPTATATGIKT